jgi:hypothetical protein
MRFRSTVALGSILLGPAAARGQSVEPPAGESGPEAVAATVDPRWSFSMRAQQSWDSNPIFVTADGEDSFAGDVGATLAYQKRGERGDLKFFADGSGRRYQSLGGEQSFNYGAGLEGRYRMTPRATVSATGRIGMDYTRLSRQLTDDGLLLPLARARTATAAGTFDLGLARATSLANEVRYESARFESDEFADGSQLRATSALRHAVSADDTLSLSYSFLNDFLPDATLQTHTISAGWNGALARRVSASASLGVNVVRSNTWENTLYGAASISSRHERGSLDLRYERSVGQAFGYGRHRLYDLAVCSFHHAASRRVDLSVALSYSNSKDPSDPPFRLVTQAGTAGIGFSLARQLRLAGGYTLNRTDEQGAEGPVLSHQVMLAMTYGVTWR